MAFSAHVSAQVSHNSLYLSVYLSNLRGQQSLCVFISPMNPRDYVFSLFNILPVVRVDWCLKSFFVCVCVLVCKTGNRKLAFFFLKYSARMILSLIRSKSFCFCKLFYIFYTGNCFICE